MDDPSSYRSEIDGLRAVAVAAVVLFHAKLGMSGGYVGVDVFFVISGFLITGIIVKKLDRGEFRMREFWSRRVCRILPASIFVTLATFLVGSVILLPYDLHELGESGASHAAMMSNVYFWDQLSTYFASDADLQPLLHTWSLAVEEQFYLFYPFLLFALYRFRCRNQLLIAIAIASFACSQASLWFDPNASFFLLPSRAWELIVGGLIFTFGDAYQFRGKSNEIVATLGIMSVLFSMFYFDNETPFPGLNAVVPVVGTALIILANRDQRTMVGRVLSFRVFTFVGLLSYSIYLWHWPMLVYARYILGENLPPTATLLFFLLTGLFSLFTWHFVEKPFRLQATKQRPIWILSFGLGASVTAGIIGVVFVASDGWPSRRGDDLLFTEDAQFGNSRFFTHNASQVPRLLPALGLPGSMQTQQVFLWGDSHAPPVADMLDELLERSGRSGAVAAKSATPPIFSTNHAAAAWNDAVLEHIEQAKIADLVIVSRWSTWLTDERTLIEVHKRLERLVKAGVRIWLLAPIPEQPFHVCRAIHARRFGAAMPVGTTLSEHKAHQEVANGYLARLESDMITVVDATDSFFDDSGIAILGTADRSYYRDDDHLSSFGAKTLLSPVFQNVLATAFRRRPAKNASISLRYSLTLESN